MAIVVKLTGDLSDLEAKMKSAGIKVEEFGDKSETAGKAASSAFSPELEQSIKNIEQATGTLASHAGGMNSLAEGFGNTERVALGLNDVLGVMAEQLGINIGPAQEYAQAAGDLAGGLEGVIGGGMALGKQLMSVPATMGPAIASTWAHVTALYAQAAAFIAANLPMIALIATIALVAAGVVLLVKHWDEITEKIPFLGTAVDAIKAKLDEFTGWITGTFVPAVASLYDPAIKVPLELIVSYFAVQFEMVKAGVETAINIIKGIIEVVMGLITGDWQRAWDGVKQIFQAAWDGMKEGVGIVIDALKALIGDLPQQILEKLGNLGDLLKQAGRDIVQGLIDGVQEMAGQAVQGVKDLAGDMVSGAKDKLKIWSPSQVFKEIGENISAGLTEGINSGAAAARDAAGNLIAGVSQVPKGSSARVEGAISGLDFDSKELTDVNTAYWLFRDGVISEAEMWNVLVRNGVAKELSSANASGGSLLGIGNAPGGEAGAVLTGSPTPTLGGSGGTNGAGGSAGGAGGGGGPKGPTTEELLGQLVALAERDRERTTQGLTLMNRLIDMFSGPQTVELVAKQGALQALAAALFDPLAQISRRQWSPA